MSYNTPLFTLTVDQFIELNTKILNQALNQLNMSSPKKEEQDIIFIKEASALTGYSESSIYTKASRLEIPVLCSGRPLTFSKSELIKWITMGKPTVAEMNAIELSNKKQK